MLGNSSALFIINLHITEYCVLYFRTFRNTELTKMIICYHSGRCRNIMLYSNYNLGR